jgi:hypothetical protein
VRRDDFDRPDFDRSDDRSDDDRPMRLPFPRLNLFGQD